MKRTLLAVGIAVILSLTFVPHVFVPDVMVVWQGRNKPASASVRYRAPFWDSRESSVLLTELIVQTTFLAVAAAVIVNLFPHKPKS